MLDTRGLVILAKDEDAIVGVVGGWLEGNQSRYNIEDKSLKQHNSYHESHFDWTAVKEEYRERGVGKTLVGKVFNWARLEAKRRSGQKHQETPLPSTKNLDSKR